jgi:glycosyltransferase involved in cell wall biosynthesis
MPLVSVIIPNYNHSKYLPKRIDSVLNQTFQDFELILLDDCSPDNSRDILESYRNHPKVSQLVYNSINSGSTFKQWNKGVSLAKGEWIWIAESDDYCEYDFLEKLLQMTFLNKEVGVVFANTHFVDRDDNLINNPYWGNPNEPQDSIFQTDFIKHGKTYCKEQLLGPIIGNASAAIFKKSIFQIIGGADETMKLCGDWKMWHNLLLHGDIAYCAQKLNFFRHHSLNVTSSKGAKYMLYESSKITFELVKFLNFGINELNAIKIKLFRQWVYWVLKERKQVPIQYRLKSTLILMKNDQMFLMRFALWLFYKLFKVKSRWI